MSSEPTTEIQAIVAAVCAEYGVTIRALRGASKIRAVAEPRQVAVYLARKITGAGFWDVGHFVARCSERAASKAGMKIWKRLPADPALQERIARIESALGGRRPSDLVHRGRP